MDYREYAWNAFAQILKNIPANNCQQIYGYDSVIIDAGVEAPGGFSSAKMLLEGLTGGRGTVDFGRQLIGEEQLPTVELFVDSPVEILKTGFFMADGVTGVKDSDGERYRLAYYESAELKAPACKGNFVVAKPTSLLSAIFHAAAVLPNAVSVVLEGGLKEDDILWAWATAPIAVLSNEESVSAKNKSLAAAKAVISIFVRGEDAMLKDVVTNYKLSSLRLHNLSSSHTIC